MLCPKMPMLMGLLAGISWLRFPAVVGGVSLSGV